MGKPMKNENGIKGIILVAIFPTKLISVIKWLALVDVNCPKTRAKLPKISFKSNSNENN